MDAVFLPVLINAVQTKHCCLHHL